MLLQEKNAWQPCQAVSLNLAGAALAAALAAFTPRCGLGPPSVFVPRLQGVGVHSSTGAPGQVRVGGTDLPMTTMKTLPYEQSGPLTCGY